MAVVQVGRELPGDFNKFWNNKFYYKFASCWLFLLIQIILLKIGVEGTETDNLADHS